jgi:hypothetical protein
MNLKTDCVLKREGSRLVFRRYWVPMSARLPDIEILSWYPLILPGDCRSSAFKQAMSHCYRADWCIGNALHLYSGRTWFESRAGHRYFRPARCWDSSPTVNGRVLHSLFQFIIHQWSYHSTKLYRSVGIQICYGLGRKSSIPSKGKKSFSSPQLPHRLWGPPVSYPMGSSGSFLGGKAAGA